MHFPKIRLHLERWERQAEILRRSERTEKERQTDYNQEEDYKHGFMEYSEGARYACSDRRARWEQVAR